MSAPVEVVLCADSAGQLFNCAVFDPHSGSEFLSYSGGNTSSRSLTVLNGEYILGAQLGKNFINVWEIQRKVARELTLLHLKISSVQNKPMCRTGYSRMMHKFLILGEYPPTCAFCQNPLSMMHDLLDCTGFN
uniref:Uncharacterized protein n=1 Tax=Sinocyclocheilus anshuiensis TaxID=1608454 RepID=A0A671LQY0_9TELE